MYAQIKKLADEAIALQNKDRMDVVLREIVVLCGQAESIDHGLVYAGGAHLEPGARLADSEALASAPSGFGLANLKMEGCAIHPDDTDAAMIDEQRARQLAAYERDVAAGGPAKAKKGAK